MADQNLTANRSTELLMLCPQATAISLNLPARLPLKRWQEIRDALAHAQGRLQWYIGDWWAFGEHKYGDRYRFAQDHLPLSSHLRNLRIGVSRLR